MKRNYLMIFLLASLTLFAAIPNAHAFKKKTGQSGMDYLGIGTSARLAAMGDASVASVSGIQGAFYNPAVLVDVKKIAVAVNQVSWIVDTHLYTVAAALSFGDYGTIAFDWINMDYGNIPGTRRVDKSVNPNGYELTGDVGVQDYSFGMSYAKRINDRFSFGLKFKYLYEDLGNAAIVVDERTDPSTGEVTKIRETRNWNLWHWGMDFGTIYDTGFHGLKFAMSMRNFSTDMKYWYEAFQLPMELRMGLSMDLLEWFLPDNKTMQLNMAVDAMHPNDYTERVHVGAEWLYLKKFALRAGYQFNHDVESFSWGMGLRFSYFGVASALNFGYTTTNYFKDVSRFSLQFEF